MGFPMKAGGGILGIIVLLAAHRSCPKLLGGAIAAASSARRSDADGRAPTEAAVRASTELEQIVCGGADDVQDYWIDAVSRRRSAPRTSRPTTVFFTGAIDTGCGQASSQIGPVLLPGRQPRVLRPRLPAAAAGASSAPPATSPRSTSSPTSTATTCRTCSASATRSASREQQNPGQANAVLGRARAAGRLLRRGVGQRRRRAAASSSRARSSEALERRRGRRRRPHPAADPGAGRPGELHPRHVRAARAVVPPRLRHRRPAAVQHVRGAQQLIASRARRRRSCHGSAAEPAVDHSTGPMPNRRCHRRRRRSPTTQYAAANSQRRVEPGRARPSRASRRRG